MPLPYGSRRFILLAGALLATSAIPALSQSRQVRIGHLSWFRGHRIAELSAELRRLGYDVGGALQLSLGVADGDAARADALAAEFVAAGVDLIVTLATPAALAAKRATRTIPIVALVADPLASGLVSNLSRPGGNITGFSTASTDVAGKWMEIAREIVPGLARVAFLGSTTDPNGAVFADRTEAAGRQLGLVLKRYMIAAPDQIAAALARAVADGGQALVVQPLFVDQAAEIVRIATAARLPVFSSQRQFAEVGAVLSMNADIGKQVAGAAKYVDRILKGEKAGDLPFQQLDRQVLLINRKAARALGLEVPTAVLLRADEVIE